MDVVHQLVALVAIEMKPINHADHIFIFNFLSPAREAKCKQKKIEHYNGIELWNRSGKK